MTDFQRLPQARCGMCGYSVNACGVLEGDTPLPAPGDICVCMKCGTVQAFADDLTLRPFREGEFESLSEEQIADVMKTAQAVRRAANRQN